jgi:hypothetical protein
MTTPDPFATPGDKIPSFGRARGDAEDRAPVPRDPWDRYWIPNLDGTMPAKNKGFTRVSTLKDSAVDKRGININNTGLVAAGIATVPALASAAARAVRDEDKKALRAIAAQAITAAGGKDRSALGTAVHDATERINRGEPDVHVPEEYQADVDSYYQLLSENNVRIKPEFMERVVLCPYNTAGTFDNIVEWFNPDAGELDDDGKPVGEWEWLIADLKTGRDLSYGYLEIMIQLWLYANAYGVLDLATNTYSPLPVEVRQDKAMIVHVPMAGGVAELWVIDISGAERYVRAAVELRRGNREAEKKWTKVGEVRPAPFVLPPETAERPLDLTGADPSSGAPLTNVLDQVSRRTPQQIADAETAERRQRIVSGPAGSELVTKQMSEPSGIEMPSDQLTITMHQGGWHIDTETVPLAEVGPVIPIAEAVGLVRNQDGGIQDKAVNEQTSVLDGEGKPLAPMAGPGKRGCSKCGRTGHRSTSKRCLGDADPAKAVVDFDGASNAFMAELPGQPAQVEPTYPYTTESTNYTHEHLSPGYTIVTTKPVGEQRPEPFTVPAVPAPHLFDPLPADKLGRCRLCGQGSGEPIHAPVWAADTADGDDAPAPGAPGGGPALPEPVFSAPATPWCSDPSHRSQGWTASADGTGWVCPIDFLPSQVTYERARVDPIAASIEACTKPDELLHIRAHEIAENRWSPTYDEQARLKHQALSWPNP